MVFCSCFTLTLCLFYDTIIAIDDKYQIKKYIRNVIENSFIKTIISMKDSLTLLISLVNRVSQYLFP